MDNAFSGAVVISHEKQKIFILVVYTCIMRNVVVSSLDKGKIVLTDDVANLLEKKVTKFGNGGKIDCPKKFIGKRVYVLILKR